MRMLRLFSVSSGEFQVPPIGLKYELQRLSHFQWIHLDTNSFETMPRKTGEKILFWYVWTRPKLRGLGVVGRNGPFCASYTPNTSRSFLGKSCYEEAILAKYSG